ncbi:Mob1/phocein [Trametes gibbosa]|nr:Mob1/phocein [Trametes gibbosa]
MAVVIQRPLKGSRISSFYPVKTLPPISALDSAFQLQEYISLLIRLDVHDVEKIVAIPGKDQNEASDNGTAKGEEKETDKDAAGGVHVDPACWVYEHLRRVAQDLSHPLITMLQQECTRNSCPEMKAGEWLYLCVAHGNDGAMEQCCAIDYILHTLDSATALLNSPRAFPSRLSVPSTSHRHFTSLCRRLGRIFAHAYFHHREVFEQAEAESSLYARFLALVKYFDLVPLEFLVIPPRMEGRPVESVAPPRLMGAALEPRRDSGPHEGGGSWPGSNEGPWRTDRGKSPPGPAGQTRNESPRKFGRPRTDTMVYSEAFSVAEELAKSDLSEVDIDREIAAERTAVTSGASERSGPSPEVPAEEPLALAAVDVPNMPFVIPSSQEVPVPTEETATEPALAQSPIESIEDEHLAPAGEVQLEPPSEEAPEAPEQAPASDPEEAPDSSTLESPTFTSVEEHSALLAEGNTDELEEGATEGSEPEPSIEVAEPAGLPEVEAIRSEEEAEDTPAEATTEAAQDLTPGVGEAAETATEPSEESSKPSEALKMDEDSSEATETPVHTALAAVVPEEPMPVPAEVVSDDRVEEKAEGTEEDEGEPAADAAVADPELEISSALP